MKMRKKYVLALLTFVLLTPIVAILVVRWMWIRNFNLPKDFITKQQLADIHALGPFLQDLGAKIKKGDLPTRFIDLKTVGATEKESDLRTFRRFVELYEITSGKLPKQASDLDSLVTTGSLKSSVKSQIRLLDRKCSVFTFDHDSYLLNCDGWHPSGADALQRMVGDFDQKTERFYIFEHHIFIYAPPSFKLIG